jgi:hypothetical protein
MSDLKNDQIMYNKATGMYLKALAEIMKALDIHSEIRLEVNGKLLKRALDDGFLCVLSNDDRRTLWNYCYDHEILLVRGSFALAKATLNCIGWAFPYRDDLEKQRVHRILFDAGFSQNRHKRPNIQRFWQNLRLSLRVRPVEIPPNIVKITLTNAFYQTAMEVLHTVNLDTQQLYRNAIYAVSPTHYAIPEDHGASSRNPAGSSLEKIT